MRQAALDIIARHLPYEDDRVISAIKHAIEDEDSRIRAHGRMLKSMWILKDTVVKNHPKSIPGV